MRNIFIKHWMEKEKKKFFSDNTAQISLNVLKQVSFLCSGKGDFLFLSLHTQKLKVKMNSKLKYEPVILCFLQHHAQDFSYI